MQILAVSTSDIESFIASGPLAEYRFGVISNTDSGDRKIAQAGANARVAGIIAENGVVGESTAVITTKGRRYMLQVDGSAVAIAPGDLLKSNGIGRGVKAGPGDCYGARAYGSATTAGAVIEVEIEFGVIPGPGAQSITGDATLTAASFQNTGALTVWVSNTDAAVNLTLPASIGLAQGTRLRVEKTTAAAFGATITRGGTDTIAGATTFTHIAALREVLAPVEIAQRDAAEARGLKLLARDGPRPAVANRGAHPRADHLHVAEEEHRVGVRFGHLDVVVQLLEQDPRRVPRIPQPRQRGDGQRAVRRGDRPQLAAPQHRHRRVALEHPKAVLAAGALHVVIALQHRVAKARALAAHRLAQRPHDRAGAVAETPRRHRQVVVVEQVARDRYQVHATRPADPQRGLPLAPPRGKLRLSGMKVCEVGDQHAAASFATMHKPAALSVDATSIRR